MEDKQIVDLYIARDENAILETQKKHGKYCEYISQQILHSEEDVKECVNDTYLSLWNSIPPENPRNLRYFVGCVVRRISLNRLDYICAEKRNPNYLTSIDEYAECIPDREPENAEALREAINAFLGSLPSQTRMVFMRRYWYHSAVAEIASDLGISEENVKVILHRTRKKFKRYLEKENLYE